MKKSILATFSALALAATAAADGLNAGSVLVYPVQYTGLSAQPTLVMGGGFTVIHVANTNINPQAGATNVHFEYVNVVELNGEVDHCNLIDRVEHLTPADHLSVLATCHNPNPFGAGYLVVSAQDPSQFDVDWAFDHLIGSELVVDVFGGTYSLNAIPFKSPCEESSSTDMDGDGQLDFDDVEYEGIPEILFIDSFVAAVNQTLVLINLTGGPKHKAFVAFDIFNDNEFALSATTSFQCWMQRCLAEDSMIYDYTKGWEGDTAVSICISPVFSQTFLANNTPNDPRELDLDCNGVGDLETGWARIRGLNASSSAESLQNPALLGALTGSAALGVGGRRLWESEAKQLNGDFLNLGTVAVD